MKEGNKEETSEGKDHLVNVGRKTQRGRKTGRKAGRKTELKAGRQEGR